MFKLFKKSKSVKEKSPARASKPENNGALAASTPSTNQAIVISTPATEPPAPILDDDEQEFLERLTTPSINEDDDERPPLPPRVKTPDLEWDQDTESFRRIQGSSSAKPAFAKKANRLSIFRRKDKSANDATPGSSRLTVPGATDSDADREKDDLTRVLDDLNLAARNNKAFSLSAESTELVHKFTMVLKDLVNGVPTATRDLMTLLDDKNGTVAKNYEKLPKSFKKLVTQLPTKLTTTFAPELLAVAAEVQGISKDEAAAKGGFKGAAKSMFKAKNTADLITKPGAVVGMLKAIVNALKVRWPAFIGTNVLWSVAVFLLLFVLWYCHKRGREERLEREKCEATGAGTDDVVVTEASSAEAGATSAATPRITATQAS